MTTTSHGVHIASGAAAPAAPYRPWVMRVLERHPGALLTGLYLALTGIGIAYDLLYFRRFGINILDYAEPGDFLVAVLRSPLTIIYSVLPAIVIWLVALFRRRRRSVRTRRGCGPRESSP